MEQWKAKNAVNKMKIVKRRKRRKNGAKMSKTVFEYLQCFARHDARAWPARAAC